MIVGTFHLSSWSWPFFEFLNLMTWESFICHLKWDGAGSAQFWTKSCQIITASKKIMASNSSTSTLSQASQLAIQRESIFMTSDVRGEKLVTYRQMGSKSNLGLSTGCNWFALQVHILDQLTSLLERGKHVVSEYYRSSCNSQSLLKIPIMQTQLEMLQRLICTHNIYFSPDAPYYCCCTYNVHNVHTLRGCADIQCDLNPRMHIELLHTRATWPSRSHLTPVLLKPLNPSPPHLVKYPIFRLVSFSVLNISL